jgi:hypothetical protein
MPEPKLENLTVDVRVVVTKLSAAASTQFDGYPVVATTINADATVFAFILPPVLNVATYYALGLKSDFDDVLWSTGCCLDGDYNRKMQANIFLLINQRHSFCCLVANLVLCRCFPTLFRWCQLSI